MRRIEEPVVTTETWGVGETETSRHPAFAQVSIHHTQGSACLYGSDFEHQSFVTLTIKRSQLNRDLNRDWHFERETMIEVALSEAQFATMISAPNRSGVPCTLLQKDMDMIPGLPRRDSMKLYDAELAQKMKDVVKGLEAHRAAIKAAGAKLPKKVQAEMLAPIEDAIREIASNVPFVMRSFDEHMETSIEKAKVEVNAYVTHAVMRAGVDALNGKPVLAIGGPNGESEK